MMREIDYIKDGAKIYEKSFAIICKEADLSRFSTEEAQLAIRIVHACGMVEAANHLVFSPDLVSAARNALKTGAPILCDSEMVAHGIIRGQLPAGNEIICTLHDARTPALAKSIGSTRSAAAIELWRDRLSGALVAIGNAPTALFHLLEIIQKGTARPAAIIGIPVGFVGAAESKEALAENESGIPFVTLRGRMGGSAIAAAAVNALARLGS